MRTGQSTCARADARVLCLFCNALFHWRLQTLSQPVGPFTVMDSWPPRPRELVHCHLPGSCCRRRRQPIAGGAPRHLQLRRGRRDMQVQEGLGADATRRRPVQSGTRMGQLAGTRQEKKAPLAAADSPTCGQPSCPTSVQAVGLFENSRGPRPNWVAAVRTCKPLAATCCHLQPLAATAACSSTPAQPALRGRPGPTRFTDDPKQAVGRGQLGSAARTTYAY